MERTTTEITTPNKQKVVINDWISGLDDETLQRSLVGEKDIHAQGEQPEISVGGDQLINYERKCIEIVVVSVNGVSDNCVDNLLALPKVDVDFVKDKVSKIVTATSQKKA